MVDPVSGGRLVRRLDPRVVAKIAAGEMILRPVSVAKELIENAIDAGSLAIEVAIGESADQSIQVSDDGCGMNREDLLLALEAHATSKLRREEDLLRIATLGFRGEALPSIGRVARMEILTSTGEEGTRIRVEGGDRLGLEPCARSRGTTVRVEDLFYNSPVRKRFLKSPESEVRMIVKLVATTALAYPAVALRLLHRGEALLELPAVEGLPARITQVHGPSFAQKILEVDFAGSGAHIQGYVGIPELARPGTQHQTLLVNQRWVSATWFSAALRQGFGDLIGPNRHPFALILLTIDPARVDVNVHPTKREVRFLDEQALFGDLVHAVRAQTRRLVPGWNLDPSDRGTGSLLPPDVLVPPASAGTPPGRWHGVSRPPQQALELLYGEARARGEGAVGEGMPGDGAGVGSRPQGEPPGPGSIPGGQEKAGSPPPAGGPEAAEHQVAPGGLVPLWQLHNRYLFAQTRQGLLIIDQHAAHERVLYEQALENLRGAPAAIQQLLFPITVELDMDEAAAWREYSAAMPELGIDAEEFGARALLLRGVPVHWVQDPQGLLRDLLHDLATRRGRGEGREERVAASFACHSAVRSGQPLSLEEMNSLIDQLFATRVPHGDPHGRPTFLRVSLADLDRRFGRG